MGHSVIYRTYPCTWTLEKVTSEVLNVVRNSGDRYGTDRVRIPTDKIFDNCEAAEDYIGEINKHDYDGIAVKYYDFTGVEDNAKIKELREKIADTVRKQKEYIDTHSVKNQKATFIGCSRCGSKINKERLRGERCPVCYADLRSKTTLDRIASFYTKVEEYDEKIKQEQSKMKKKAKVKWLVKFEYHC